MTPGAHEALRRRRTLLAGGSPPFSPGEVLIAAFEWCKANGWAPDRYGEGPVVADFESKILGCEAAMFAPSATMAQPIALRIARVFRELVGMARERP